MKIFTAHTNKAQQYALLCLGLLSLQFTVFSSDSCGKSACEVTTAGTPETIKSVLTKDEHAGPTNSPHDEHEGQAHAELPKNLSLEHRLALKCEHQVLTHQCDECRYELGFVKVTPDMLKSQGGIIALESVKKESLPKILETIGEIRLDESQILHVSPNCAGRISNLYTRLGQNINVGDPLFEIESMEFSDSVGSFRRAFSTVELSRQKLDREKKLLADRANSASEVLEAQAVLEQAEVDFGMAEQRLYSLGYSSNLVKDLKNPKPTSLDRDRYLIYRSTTTGTVLEQHLTAGELAEPGKDVMLLGNLDKVWAWLDIFENDLDSIERAYAQGPVQLKVSVLAYPDLSFSGNIDYLGTTVDELRRTIRVRANIDNAHRRLRPGMFCKAKIALVGDGEKSLALPREAVLRDEGASFVFRKISTELFLKTPIQVGRSLLGKVEILSGVNEGEVVSGEGSFLLKSDVLREKMGAGCAD